MAALTTSSAISLASALVVLAGAGVSVAAESAVPGDVLYPVKTGVNENIRASLAVGTSSEAEVEAELAQRRLEEMIHLAAAEALSSETKAELSEGFQLHSENAFELAAQAEASGDAEAKQTMAAFQDNLETYLEVLAEMKGDAAVSAEAEALSTIVSDVQTNMQGEIHVESESQIHMNGESDVEVDHQSNATSEVHIDL